jgi:hypothetical protein
MTTRVLAMALAIALAILASLGCKASRSDTTTPRDAAAPTEAGPCVVGQSAIGDCAL